MRVAGRLIEGALSDLRQIEALEEELAPAGLARFDRQAVALIRGMYEQWAHDAQSLLDRVAQAERKFGKAPGGDSLRDSLGRTLAMLSVSIEDREAGRDELLADQTISREDAWSELRPCTH